MGNALCKQRQVDCYEFKAILVYTVSYRTARATWRDPASENKNADRKKDSTSGAGEMPQLLLFLVPRKLSVALVLGEPSALLASVGPVCYTRVQQVHTNADKITFKKPL